MDARTLAAAARVQVTTLNAWIHRGHIPDVPEVGRGRGRDFDFDTAVRIALMVELVRLGLGAPEAAVHAEHYSQRPWPRLLLTRDPPFDPATATVTQFDENGNPRPADPAYVAQMQETMRSLPAAHGYEDESQLPEIFKQMGGAPTSFMVVNLERIREKMRRAEEEWQARSDAAS
jgi:hypothetical protein